jgi:hypothetical protein
MRKLPLRDVFSWLPPQGQVVAKSMLHLGYWPDLARPKSFNEKVQVRKLNWKNPLFPVCADKHRVRDYVRQKIGGEHLIPRLFSGRHVAVDTVADLCRGNSGIVIKANHNSGGPAFLLRQGASHTEIAEAVAAVLAQLDRSYGRGAQETWYDEIPERLVLVEELLLTPDGGVPEDWKFHVFTHGTSSQVLLQIDFDQFTAHNRTFYDTDLNMLPFANTHPNHFRPVVKPEGFERMISIARTLAAEFTYARVDLYNVAGAVFFGELTFANESGAGRFTPRSYDYWMGDLWQGDPRY